MEVLLVIGQTVAVYLFLVIVMRRIGRTSLSGLTPIGYVSIALLGSAVETALYKGEPSLSAGLASAGTLIILDWLITISASKWPMFRIWLAGETIVLLQDGLAVPGQLKRACMTEDDLKAAMRQRGYYRFGEVRLAVLEADGTVSIIPAAQPPR